MSSSSSEKQAINLMTTGKGRLLQVINSQERQHYNKYIKFLETEQRRFKLGLEKQRSGYFERLREYYSKLYSKGNTSLDDNTITRDKLMWINSLDLKRRHFKFVSQKMSEDIDNQKELSEPVSLNTEPKTEMDPSNKEDNDKIVGNEPFERKKSVIFEEPTYSFKKKSNTDIELLKKSQCYGNSVRLKREKALDPIPFIKGQTTLVSDLNQTPPTVNKSKQKSDIQSQDMKTSKQISLDSIPSCLKIPRPPKRTHLLRHRTLPDYFTVNKRRFESIPEEPTLKDIPYEQSDNMQTVGKQKPSTRVPVLDESKIVLLAKRTERVPVAGMKQNNLDASINEFQQTDDDFKEVDCEYDPGIIYTRYHLPPIYKTSLTYEKFYRGSPLPPNNTPDSMSSEFEKLKTCRYLRNSCQY